MNFQRLTWKPLMVSLILFGVVGCGTSDSKPEVSNTASNKPKIVASYSVLCDLTQQIAQDTIDLKCLIPAGQDPHLYQPTPDDRKSIDTGALVLYGGYDFEPSIIKLVKAAGQQDNKIAVHELAVPKPLMNEGHHDHGEAKSDHDKSKESSLEADPHVWHNAKNGVAIVQVLQDKLTKIAPQNAPLYSKNSTALRDRLTKIDNWIQTSISTIPAPAKKLVTTHDALTYYGTAYNIPIVGALQGLSTDEQPTATRIKSLVDQIKSTQVPTIFTESTANPKLIETVAKEANVKISQKQLFVDGLGEQASGAETYEKMLIWNTTVLVEGLSGKITPGP
jgi:manganese/iron transport system substrate-binding protein